MKTWIAFTLSLLVSFPAGAVTETNKTIVSMGVQDTTAATGQGPQQAYAILNPPPNGGCIYGVVYIKDLSTPGGTALLSMLQKAYSLGKPLSRIDYVQVGAQCFITLIEVGQ